MSADTPAPTLTEPSEIIVSGHDFDRMTTPDAPPTKALVELFREHDASDPSVREAWPLQPNGVRAGPSLEDLVDPSADKAES